jgi:membrane-associated phospholipid phosphatase
MSTPLKHTAGTSRPLSSGRAISIPGGIDRVRHETFAAGFRNYLLSDWAVTLYVALTGISAALWGSSLTHRWTIVTVHLSLPAVVYVIARYLSANENRAVRFLRLFYIPLLLTFFYEETSALLHLFHPGWLDSRIIAWERGLLGVSPTLWIQPWQNSLLNEWMMMGYFSYYIIIAAPFLTLFFKHRDHDAAQLVWATSLAFFISYLGFIVCPVQGPRYEFAGLYDSELTGFLFVPLVQKLMHVAAIHGGCMPSSHVAVAIVSMVYIMKYNKRLGIVTIPLVVTLCLGTVWGRFHYLSDVVGGIIIAGFAIWAAGRYPVKFQMGKQGLAIVRPNQKHIDVQKDR